jgi:tetratricopeptide (TPR) repeat protein
MRICAKIKIHAIIAVGCVLLLSGCVNTPTSTAVYNYQQPSRPMLSSQERANLTEADIVRMIQLADEAYENGKYTVAKDIYYEVILVSKEPDVYVLNSYGVCLASLGLYNNALTIFNMALKNDPGDETVMGNIQICRQFIAAQTEAQRQRELEQQRQQQENMQNLIASLNNMSNALAGMSQSNQNISGSSETTSSSTSDSGSAGSGSSSSSGRSQSTGDWGSYQRNYNQRAKATEMALDNYRKDPSTRLLEEFRARQRSLKEYRLECNRRIESQGGRANYIGASFYETVNP